MLGKGWLLLGNTQAMSGRDGIGTLAACARDNIELYSTLQYDARRNGYQEPEDIKCMRQYLILAVLADDFEFGITLRGVYEMAFLNRR